jgi:type II secretory pathway pseudopilin PulG
MSNVLIGIIGVILFIGLALAGALFLGPRFQAATNDSRASAIVQALQQTQNAYEMRRVNVGTPTTADQGNAVVQTLIDEGYLKARYRNPFNQAISILAVDDGGTQVATKPISSFVMTLDADTNKTAKEVCRIIERRMGATDDTAYDTPVMFDVKLGRDKRIGCFHNAYSNEYAVYTAI